MTFELAEFQGGKSSTGWRLAIVVSGLSQAPELNQLQGLSVDERARTSIFRQSWPRKTHLCHRRSTDEINLLKTEEVSTFHFDRGIESLDYRPQRTDVAKTS